MGEEMVSAIRGGRHADPAVPLVPGIHQGGTDAYLAEIADWGGPGRGARAGRPVDTGDADEGPASKPGGGEGARRNAMERESGRRPKVRDAGRRAAGRARAPAVPGRNGGRSTPRRRIATGPGEALGVSREGARAAW